MDEILAGKQCPHIASSSMKFKPFRRGLIGKPARSQTRKRKQKLPSLKKRKINELIRKVSDFVAANFESGDSDGAH